MTILEEGQKAPNFVGKNQLGQTLSLDQFKGKTLILYFYPKDNTPGCTSEACNLRDNYRQLLSKGFEVVGVSPDSEKSHQGFIEKQKLPFHLIADVDKTILKVYGAWGMKKMYGKEYEGVLRRVFVIDGNGMIAKIITKVDTKNPTEQILKALS